MSKNRHRTKTKLDTELGMNCKNSEVGRKLYFFSTQVDSFDNNKMRI